MRLNDYLMDLQERQIIECSKARIFHENKCLVSSQRNKGGNGLNTAMSNHHKMDLCGATLQIRALSILSMDYHVE